MSRRAVLALAICACELPEAAIVLRPEPPTCRREPVSAVRLTLLGDFAPMVFTGGVGQEVEPLRVPLGAARSVSVEGLSVRTVAALGWSGPLPALRPGEERAVPLLYGARDSLCQVWGLRVPRAFHRATLLSPTELLVTGGVGPDGPTDTLERYRADSPEGQRPLPTYEGAALGHSATALPDGTLLLAGGGRPTAGAGDEARQRARVYRATGEPAGGVLLLEGGPRAMHAATSLPGGAVFLTGGCSRLDPLQPGRAPSCPRGALLDTTVRYEGPGEQGGFLPGPLLLQPRYGHDALVLSDGRVLLVGGYVPDPRTGDPAPAREAEILDPLAAAGSRPGALAGVAGAPAALLPTEGLLFAGSLPEPAGVLVPGEGAAPLSPLVPRAGATLTALLDGTALLVGGRDAGDQLVPTVELYEGGAFRALPDALPRSGHAALLLPDGTVLLLGGVAPDGRPTPLVARFIHGLRVPDATPPPWPLPALEAQGWIVARRPDRVRFDGTELQVEAPQASEHPAELALIAGVRWARGELRIHAALAEGGRGLALVLGHQGGRRLHFLRIAPDRPLALLRLWGAQPEPVPGCEGPAPSLSELRAGIPLTLRLAGGTLMVSSGGTERLRCRPDLPERGAVGFGSLGGLALFRGFSLTRE